MLIWLQGLCLASKEMVEQFVRLFLDTVSTEILIITKSIFLSFLQQPQAAGSSHARLKRQRKGTGLKQISKTPSPKRAYSH